MTTNPPRTTLRGGGDHAVAVILAVGICTALNLLVFAVIYDALFSDSPGLSENATQILTGWGGGILSVIGAVVGYKAGEMAQKGTQEAYNRGRGSGQAAGAEPKGDDVK
jgi:hypothetical protein